MLWLLRTGHADQMPLGVGELPDDQASGSALGTHVALPAEALGLLERGLDVGYAHVEQDTPLIALATADTTVDAVVGRARVHEPVVTGLGDRVGGRVAGLELPPKQLAVVAPKLCRIPSDDLEVHNWLSHGVSFPAARTAVGSSLSGFAIGTSVIVETHRSDSTASGLSAAIRAASPQRASVTLIAATVLDGDGTREILLRRMRERQNGPAPAFASAPAARVGATG